MLRAQGIRDRQGRHSPEGAMSAFFILFLEISHIMVKEILYTSFYEIPVFVWLNCAYNRRRKRKKQTKRTKRAFDRRAYVSGIYGEKGRRLSGRRL